MRSSIFPSNLIFICLAHSTADFAEFPREIIDGGLVKLRFIPVAGFEGLDNPRQGLIVDVNGFDEFGNIAPDSTANSFEVSPQRGGVSSMCDCSSIHIQKIFFLRSIEKGAF